MGARGRAPEGGEPVAVTGAGALSLTRCGCHRAERAVRRSGCLRTFGPDRPLGWSEVLAVVAIQDGAAVHGEFTRLHRGESMPLRASVPVGRLIFTVGALPAVR